MSSVRALAAGCLLPGFRGTRPPGWLRRQVAGGLGGVTLFARNVAGPEQVAELTARLRAERADLLIAIDEEGGDVTRLEARTGSSYPGNLALGAAGDLGLTRSVAGALGADLAAAGVNLDLAPVADVNSNPQNPVIGVRSFGADPELVAAHTAAFVEGLQSQGVAACVKHFPGHGDTSVDSHLGLPVAAGGEEALEAALLPFRAAIAAGVRAVMTAHVVVPTRDSVPATLSPAVLTDLLRGRLSFDGLVVTDALEMAAIRATAGLVDGGVRALAAGADALCIGGGEAGEDVVTRYVDALEAAVRLGRLSEERLAGAAWRLAATARWAAASRHRSSPSPARSVGLEAARRAVTARCVPPVGTTPVLVELRPEPGLAAGPVPWGLREALARRAPGLTVLRLDGVAGVGGVLGAAAGRPLVLSVRDLHRHPAHAAAVARVLAGRPDAIVVEMGLPAHPPAAGAYVATRGAGGVNAEAAVELLAAGVLGDVGPVLAA